MLKKKDFQIILKHGRRKSGAFLVSYTYPSEKKRLGVVVSKKVSRLATKRNKIKRWLREASRDLLKDGFSVILISRPGILNHSWQQIKEEVKKHLL
jgi:ribonuclease P protein component